MLLPEFNQNGFFTTSINALNIRCKPNFHEDYNNYLSCKGGFTQKSFLSGNDELRIPKV